MIAAVLLLASVLAAQRDDAPRLEIVSPKASDYVVGDVTIQAAVSAGRDHVTVLTVAVDGILACRVTSVPFTCTASVGPELRARVIRVVATLASGERLAKTVVTADAPFRDRADVSSVLVPVSVRDRNGRFISGLQQGQFRLFDNDHAQPITFFAPEGAACDIMLAVDISGSMAPHLGVIRQAVSTFLTVLRPSDAVTLAAFNTAFFVIAPPSAPATARQRAVDRLVAWGGTALYDAMYSALETMSARQGRRALVLFTDGEDHLSTTMPQRVRDRLLSEDIVLYVVGHGSAADLPIVRNQLAAMAQSTGGRAIFISSLDKAERAFRDVVADLAQLYTLGFSPTEPPGDGIWRKLRVEVDGGSAYVIRARDGYVLSSARN